MNIKTLSAIAIVLALVILGSEVWERRANSGETLLDLSNMPQITDEKPAPDELFDEEVILDEETPEIEPNPINPQPKRRFIPRGISGGCDPGYGYYEGGYSPGYSYSSGYSYPGYSYSYSYGCR